MAVLLRDLLESPMHPLEPWQAASAQLAHLRVQRVAVLLRDHDGSCARPALLPCKRVLQRLALIKSFVRAMRAKARAEGEVSNGFERNEAIRRDFIFTTVKNATPGSRIDPSACIIKKM